MNRNDTYRVLNHFAEQLLSYDIADNLDRIYFLANLKAAEILAEIGVTGQSCSLKESLILDSTGVLIQGDALLKLRLPQMEQKMKQSFEHLEAIFKEKYDQEPQ